jgi:hypothetical protein
MSSVTELLKEREAAARVWAEEFHAQMESGLRLRRPRRARVARSDCCRPGPGPVGRASGGFDVEGSR